MQTPNKPSLMNRLSRIEGQVRGIARMVDEDRFVGHAAGTVDSRFEAPAFPDRAEFNPGGLAVLWAEENSRPALFAAMKRRCYRRPKNCERPAFNRQT